MKITHEQIEAMNENYLENHQVDGIAFCRWTVPGQGVKYDSGADNALFTGFYLASAALGLSSSKDPHHSLLSILDTLEGIELLTNVSGTPGVLARLAFPLQDAYDKIGYAPDDEPKPLGWAAGNTWFDRKKDGSLYESDTHFYYCRTTRDQLTGIVFGLSVAWVELARLEKLLRESRRWTGQKKSEVEARSRVSEVHGKCTALVQSITGDLVDRLEETNWDLKDHTGYVGDTNANKPSNNLKIALKFLNSKINNKPMPSVKKLDRFYKYLWLHTFYYRFTRATYAWNLRATIAYTLYLNDPREGVSRRGAIKWMKRILKFTKKEDNAYFVMLGACMGIMPSSKRWSRALKALESLAEHGHNSWFAWQKPKGEAKHREQDDRSGPNIDIMLPFWLYQKQLAEGGHK